MRRPVLAILVCLLSAFSAAANVIQVEVTQDVLAIDQVCTLREAIINANDDAATWPDCGAGSGVDTIEIFPTGTLNLQLANANLGGENVGITGDLDIHSSMIILGNPAGTTAIDAHDLDRIFDINPDGLEPGFSVTINDLHLTNGFGHGGGGNIVIRGGSLTLERVTITNSHGSQGDAGALYTANQTTLTVTNCTFSGNTAAHHAGAILIESGNASFTSTTITNNSSGFTNLTGGIRAGGNITLRNCLIAGNGGVNLPNVDGLFTSLGYNIIGEYGDTPGNPIIAPAVGDQLDINDALVNFGPLQNNGGTTPTHELLAGSIAIDAGHSSGTTADQRGLTRPCDLGSVANATGGDGGDVGAFEVQGACAAPNTDPDAVDDAFNVNQDSGANLLDVLANDTDADGDTLIITAVTQGANGSVTNNGTSVSYTPNPGFIGNDAFTYTIDDTNGGTDTATVNVTVLDTEAPEIDVDVAVGTLWPPNHQFVDVGLSVVISDNGGGFTTTTAVYSDEDDGASPDATGSLLLRAERSGSGDGRVYLIAVTATDASANTSYQCVAVVVPKSQSAAHINSVNAQAAAAVAHCNATGTAPAGYFVVGE